MDFSEITRDFVAKILAKNECEVIAKEENENMLLVLVHMQPFGEKDKYYQIYFGNKQASCMTCLQMDKTTCRLVAKCIFLSIKKSLFAIE